MKPSVIHSILLLGALAPFAILTGCGSGTTATSTVTVTPPVTPVTPPVTPVTPPITPPVTPQPPAPSTPAPVTSCDAFPAATTPPSSGIAFSGQILGCATPVIGASVQIYAAGTTGNGSAPTKLLANALITDSTGAFNVPTFTCPSNSSVIYVVATGGHAGTTGATNPGTVLMSSPGTCGSIAVGSKFAINEATTVASAFAFAQFLKPGAQLGASAGNSNGIALAAGTLANLMNVTLGTSPGPNFPMTGSVPSAKISTLANVMNLCIFSTGPSSTACSQFYAAATVSGTTPSNTLDAVLNLAKNPATGVAAIFAQAPTLSPAYNPALTDAPADWTLFVTYAGGGMNDPSGLSIDSGGNVWVASYFYAASLFTNTGIPVLANGVSGNGLYNSYGAAVDANDVVWVPNEQSTYNLNSGLGTVTLLTNAGAPTAGSPYSAGGLNFPISISVDATNVSWIVDYGNSHLTILNNSGVPQSGSSGYTTSQFIFPVAVATDSKRSGWIANQSSNTVTKVLPDGSAFTSYTVGDGPSGVAVDGSDNVWTANYYGNSVGLITSKGTVASGAGFVGGGISHPQGIAVDGSGNVWVANYRGPSLTQLSGAASSSPGTALSPAAGWGPDAQLLEAFALAIDASGNIWVSNFGNNTITQFIGMATPVKTPLLGPVRIP